MQLAHTHSDGIVPDLHRVPYESIAGTYSIGKNSQIMNLLKLYNQGSFLVNTLTEKFRWKTHSFFIDKLWTIRYNTS